MASDSENLLSTVLESPPRGLLIILEEAGNGEPVINCFRVNIFLEVHGGLLWMFSEFFPDFLPLQALYWSSL